MVTRQMMQQLILKTSKRESAKLSSQSMRFTRCSPTQRSQKENSQWKNHFNLVKFHHKVTCCNIATMNLKLKTQLRKGIDQPMLVITRQCKDSKKRLDRCLPWVKIKYGRSPSQAPRRTLLSSHLTHSGHPHHRLLFRQCRSQNQVESRIRI